MVKYTKGTKNQKEDTKISCCSNSLVQWLLFDSKQIKSISNLLKEVCIRLLREDIPLWRMYCQIQTLHPQAIATSYTWLQDTKTIKEIASPHGGFEKSLHLESPCAVIFDSATSLRRDLTGSNPQLDFPILKDLHAQHATDYIAFPIKFSDGQTNVFSVTTNHSEGFNNEHLGQIMEMLPVLALRLECMVLRRTAGTLLNTYLGHHSGERVLNGLIKRGDGEDLRAVIWYCDLRDSTRLSTQLDRKTFLATLNDFFDCMGGAVVNRGGEILSFIGDAMLAIFPIEGTNETSNRIHSPINTACENAIVAAKDAQTRVGLLNKKRIRDLKPPLEFGIALHIGDVIYGNIGISERLEFTVIGTAVNEVTRVESLCKILGKPILASEIFAANYENSLVPCGYQELKGIDGRQQIYALDDNK